MFILKFNLDKIYLSIFFWKYKRFLQNDYFPMGLNYWNKWKYTVKMTLFFYFLPAKISNACLILLLSVWVKKMSLLTSPSPSFSTHAASQSVSLDLDVLLHIDLLPCCTATSTSRRHLDCELPQLQIWHSQVTSSLIRVCWNLGSQQRSAPSFLLVAAAF